MFLRARAPVQTHRWRILVDHVPSRAGGIGAHHIACAVLQRTIAAPYLYWYVLCIVGEPYITCSPSSHPTMELGSLELSTESEAYSSRTASCFRGSSLPGMQNAGTPCMAHLNGEVSACHRRLSFVKSSCNTADLRLGDLLSANVILDNLTCRVHSR